MSSHTPPRRKIAQETLELDPDVLLRDIDQPCSGLLLNYAEDFCYPEVLDLEYFHYLLPIILQSWNGGDFASRCMVIEFLNRAGTRRHVDRTFLTSSATSMIVESSLNILLEEIHDLSPSLEPSLDWVRLWNTFLCCCPQIEERLLDHFLSSNSIQMATSFIQWVHLVFVNQDENAFRSLTHYDLRPEMRHRYLCSTGFVQESDFLSSDSSKTLSVISEAFIRAQQTLKQTEHAFFVELSDSITITPDRWQIRRERLSRPE